MHQPLTLQFGAQRVSALWTEPRPCRAGLVLAHGAGAGMTHRALAATAEGLFDRGVASLRYQFPYMERGGKRVDPPPIAHAAVRAAAGCALERLEPGVPLFAGGRSFGARMTSQAQALEPLDGVRGLVFFAFPLHPAGRPSRERADHLRRIDIPMLFLQGDRDALAEIGLLRETVGDLQGRALLTLSKGADHAFHVPASTGRIDGEAFAELLDAASLWMTSQV